MVIAFKI